MRQKNEAPDRGELRNRGYAMDAPCFESLNFNKDLSSGDGTICTGIYRSVGAWVALMFALSKVVLLVSCSIA